MHPVAVIHMANATVKIISTNGGYWTRQQRRIASVPIQMTWLEPHKEG